jgi:thiamine-monophosphate kinase
MKVDMLVQRTDMPKAMTFRDAAWKTVAMCVSDFASKGVKPDSFMISLGLKKGTSKTKVGELAKGLRDAEDYWGIDLLGGDTNEAGELIIDCAMIGWAESLVTRGGVRPGDAVVVTGRFGLPPAGLMILQEGAVATGKFKRRAVESVLHPTPNLKLGLALAPFLTAGLDSSDGLARSLHILAKASKVGIEVDSLPFEEGVKRFAKQNKLDANHLVLAGGEEYLIVGALKPGKLDEAAAVARKHGGDLIMIGKATREKERVVLKSGDVSRPIADEGWTHLG